MNKIKKTLLFCVIFLTLASLVYSGENQFPPSDGDEGGETAGTGTGPSSSSSSSSITGNSGQIVIIGNTKITGSAGLVENGDSFSVSSADSIYAGGFVFNDVNAASIAADGNTLKSASVTSGKDENKFVIKNPLDSTETEKINIYLNSSQSFSYSFDSENVSFTIPEKSRAVISKGSKNITIEPNGPTATIKIDNSKIIGAKGEVYDKPQYTIIGANLTYQNKDIIERLVTLGEAKVRIDTEKGFGYLLLNGQTNILPGDSYEYYDLRKKERSYSLYNNGESAYEYGFLKAGFIYELLSVIAPTAINYGFEGSSEITLKGIIEYKRMQSFNQVKAIAGTYANYLTMQLPYIAVYGSNMAGNEYKMNLADDYTAIHKLDSAAENIANNLASVQNSGHFRIELATHSPLTYYWSANLQDCPDYGKKTITLPSSTRTPGDVKIENGTLTYRNLKIFTPNTADYNNMLDKLKQMIITNNPERFSMITID